ncbi:MAG: response regulator transcription factor [Lachnospiraceae bacterium]|nr:response regulator transcription factor [Lachnospiraceae bacterium]
MNILIIEDDKNLCHAVSWQLQQEGHSVDCCHNGGEANLYIKRGIYDLILLDCMLPEEDGLHILRSMRSEGNLTPVIILSALGEVNDRVTGLNAGADDYLIKPFAYSELAARISSLFRRKNDFGKAAVSYGDLSLDSSENSLCCKNKKCSLSHTESELMSLLLQSGDKTTSRTVLLHKVWGVDTSVEDSNLDNYIYFLRKRLKTLESGVSIVNRRGHGYRLEYHDTELLS